ncbi:MAG: hypothetical protein EBS01_12530, partial [Verrucomicrobia bacterium]|nr:hypothetical protein [Verrucomicrobiota bacterium]
LFLRAFREGSQIPGSRPSPAEWISELQALGENLKRCDAWPAHRYWRGAAVCPWCKILQTAHIDLFPHQSQPEPGAEAASASHLVWADRLLSLTFDPLQFGPPSAAMQSAAAGTLERESASWVPSFMQRIPFVQRSIRLTQISTLKSRALSAADELRALSAQASDLFLNFAAQAHPFLKESRDLSAKLKTLGTKSSEAVKQAQARHYRDELQRYLERQLLQRAQIPGLGQSRRATLQSYHIITASDVNETALREVPGFGVGLTRKLLDWRALHESEFRLRHRPSNAHQGTPAFTATVQKEAGRLVAKAQQLIKEVGAVRTQYLGAFTPLQASYHEAFAKCSALEARIKKLGEE